jgi:hypothetical protein
MWMTATQVLMPQCNSPGSVFQSITQETALTQSGAQVVMRAGCTHRQCGMRRIARPTYGRVIATGCDAGSEQGDGILWAAQCADHAREVCPRNYKIVCAVACGMSKR